MATHDSTTIVEHSVTMACISPQSPWFHSLNPTNNNNGFSSSLTKPTSRNYTFFNTLKASSSPSSSSNLEPENTSNQPQGEKTDPVKLAFEKAKSYRKSVHSKTGPNEPYTGAKNESPVLEARNGGNQEVPASLKIALEKAKEYKKNKGIVGNVKGVEKSPTISGLEDRYQKTPQKSLSEKITKKKETLSISSIDFVGLGFADKKISRGLPPGLVPFSEPYPDGDILDVEILVGDTSRFENDTETKLKIVDDEDDDDSETYKPKVSTWGVFPRPSNISKTFGGGRVIRPGEQLETVEDKAAKQKRTREFLAAYRKRTGINVDPKVKLECEKILENGDSLMDLGKLKEALTFYQEVIDKLPFQAILALKAWLKMFKENTSKSKLVDIFGGELSNEARVMYEKLQSHPSYKVSKRARQFMFGFQAMEMMKVKSTSVSATNPGYQNFFEAFIERKVDYSLKDAQVEEQADGALGQAIPYIVFLVSPIFLVLFIAARKGM